MKGQVLTNADVLRKVHNSFARYVKVCAKSVYVHAWPQNLFFLLVFVRNLLYFSHEYSIRRDKQDTLLPWK